MFSDTQLLNELEAGNPGLRNILASKLVDRGISPPVPECGLCHAPVENGCEHVARMATSVPSGQMVDRRCRNCSHTWAQPSKTGACPSCHSRDVVNLNIRHCTVPRA